MSPENQPYVISHAQNREDIILSGFFKGLSKGFYVDVGANDPSADSVTKNFYERGWSGINIEPIRVFHKKLEDARPRDINLNIGISNTQGKLIFREYKKLHGLSTFAPSIQEDYDKMSKKDERYNDYEEYSVEIKTLKQVFDEQKVEVIHFMKVDVEGYEYEVLQGNDWHKYRPKVLCIESNHMAKDWRPILKKNNYSLVFFDGLNDYYVAGEATQVMEGFSYTQTVLPVPIVDYRVVSVIEFYKKAKMQADSQNVELNNEIYALRHRLYESQAELAELSRLKGLLKALLRKLDTIVEEKIMPKIFNDEAVKLPTTVKDINDGESPAEPREILAAIQRYDSQNLTLLNPPKHSFRYATLRLYRVVVKRNIRRFAIVLYKALRLARTRLRRRG